MTPSNTSAAANRAVTECGAKARHKQIVLEAFRNAIHWYNKDGTPVTEKLNALHVMYAGTYQAIADKAGLTHERARKRLTELADIDGLIYRTNYPGFTESNCRATVWALTDKGKYALGIQIKPTLF